MSQPRRRRRRRRKSGAPSDPSKTSDPKPTQQSGHQQKSAPARRRRRRGRARGEPKQPAEAKSSEDLVRAHPRQRPATLTAPHDGQTLEGIIGELQSEYGVPQYPQEYRITLKVADEKDSRGEQAVVEERKDPEADKAEGPRREKAPAPPALIREGATAPPRGRRRRGRRGRRRRGDGGGGSATS